MHIAFLITRGDAVGGATVHVRDMARALREHGHQASVLIGGDGEAVHEISRHSIPCRTLSQLTRSIHPVRDLAALAQVLHALRDLRPDLVSTHTAKAGWLGRLASRIAGTPAIFTPHGWAISDRISPAKGQFFRLAERAAAPLAQAIVNVCEAEKQLAERHRIAPPGKLVVIHNGVRDVPPSLRADPRSDPPRFIMVARCEPPKDHETVLRAFAQMRSAAWRLELVGGGPGEPAIRSLVRHLSLEGRVDFTPSSAIVSERLAASQVFVLSSRSEGFPRSILEAMRAGLPVVASDVGGVSEAVVHGQTGMVVPRQDPQALSSALLALEASPALRARLGAAGRRRYENLFTFDRMFEQTLCLYRQVLGATHVKPVAAPVHPLT